VAFKRCKKRFQGGPGVADKPNRLVVAPDLQPVDIDMDDPGLPGENSFQESVPFWFVRLPTSRTTSASLTSERMNCVREPSPMK
jgi:hypothetical protein